MIEVLNIVVLNRDLPEQRLTLGDIGAVVHKYAGGAAFEVEFVTGLGKTIAVVTVSASDIRLMEGHEILHVRKLAAQHDIKEQPSRPEQDGSS
jgi:hypothetical protein